MGRKGTYADPTGERATATSPGFDMDRVHAALKDDWPANGDEVNLNDPKRPLAVRDLDAKRFYLLTGHSIRLLDAGDMFVHNGRLVTVEDVKRKRAGGREIRLSNAYVFDSALPMYDDVDINIYRPRRGF